MKTVWFALVLILVMVGLFTSPADAAGQQQDDKTPWWEQGRISWCWGFGFGGVHVYPDVSKAPGQWDRYMRNLSQIGITALVDLQGLGRTTSDEEFFQRASLARKYGLRYFPTRFGQDYRRHPDSE